MHENSPPNRRRMPAAGRGLAAVAAGLACAAGLTCAVGLAAGLPAHAATGAGPLALPPGNTQLNAVSADSASDAWAVGTAYTAPAGSGYYQSLTLHWNGTKWAKVASPDPGGTSLVGGENGTYLEGVAALSPTNAWAVGYDQPSSADNLSLILHWNGTKWAKVASPSPGGTSGRTQLDSISADSATDIWAAGYYTNSSGDEQALLVHWNGTKWAKVTAPNGGATSSWLSGVTAISATDAWAGGDAGGKTLLDHWNGTAWSQATAPNPGTTGNNVVNAVGSSSAANVWGIGFYNITNGNKPLALHLKSSGAWAHVTMPDPSTDHIMILNGVATTAAKSTWAVGSYTTGSGVTEASLTAILQWNGTAWTQVTSPNPAGTSQAINDLTAISADTSSDVWAVGYYSHSSPDETFIVHWNGTSWTQVTSPN